MGLIGTDAICAQQIAEGAADNVKAYVAPTIAYTPAPFNTAFPGTLSISEPLFEALVGEILDGLIRQGFEFVYFVNGHGANLAILSSSTSPTAASRALASAIFFSASTYSGCASS